MNAPPDLDVWPHNRKVFSQIIEFVARGSSCALLGPRFSGKSTVLEAARRALPSYLAHLYIDLHKANQTSQLNLFASVAQMIAEYTRQFVDLPPLERTNMILREVIDDSIRLLKRDMVLILDHLETVPDDLLQGMLRALRAAYSERQREDNRLILVVSGALSLAKNTVGATSPFGNILSTVLIGDLTDQESQALINDHLESADVDSSPGARESLLEAARGDPHLIRFVCKQCIQVKPKRLVKPAVERIMREFVETEAANYPAFQEAVRLIKADPDLLHAVRLLLERDTVPKTELLRSFSPDIDLLYLTGLVREVGYNYQLRNEIYRAYLHNYFTPGQIGHLLVMMGRWEEAINHLEANITAGNKQYSTDLLTATIQSMYASETIELAAYYLARGLSAVFEVEDAQIWHYYEQEATLKLIGQLPKAGDFSELAGRTISIAEKDKLEVQVFEEAYSKRGPEEERAIPLLMPPRRQPVGVVVIGDNITVQQERELISYLNQAARAIQEIRERQAQKELAETLRKSATVISASLDLEKVTGAILEQMQRVLPFDSASIQLVDETQNALHIIAAKNFEDYAAVKKISFPLDDDDFPNARVWRDKVPRSFKDVQSFKPFSDPRYHSTHVRGWLGVPLIVRDEAIGVITLDSKTRGCYTEEHENLAVIFAGQAALAIENARLFAEVQKRAEELSTLADVVREISAEITEQPRTILDSIVRGACKTTGADCAVVYPFLSRSTESEYEYDTANIAAYGLKNPNRFIASIQPRVTGGHMARAIVAQGMQVVNDIDAGNNRPGRKSRFMRREAIQAFVGVRLPVGEGTPVDNECLGVLFVNFRAVHEFTGEELETIRLFANHAAIAIRNARRFQYANDKLEKRIAEVETLHRVDIAISSTLELSEVLDMILAEAMDLTNAPFGTVQLVREEENALEFVVGKGAEVAKGERLRLGEGITGLAAKEGRVYRIPDVTSPEWADIYLPYAPDMRSELAVPMILDDKVIGVVNIEKAEVGAFSDDDESLLKGLAQQAAIAINNATRYEERDKAYKDLAEARDRLVASEAVAWLGLFGADWQHTINQKTFSIRQCTNGLRSWLSKNDVPGRFADVVSQGLYNIEEVTQAIQELKFTSQVPSKIPQEAREQTPGEPASKSERSLIDKELLDIVKHWCDRRHDVTPNFDLDCSNIYVAIGGQWLSVAMEKLVNNALKAMPQGGTLTIKTECIDDMVHVTIRDTGRGIPDYARPNFLRRSIQHPEDTNITGTGMGALIARFVIQGHGGNLELIDSRPGWGTELLMTLPMA